MQKINRLFLAFISLSVLQSTNIFGLEPKPYNNVKTIPVDNSNYKDTDDILPFDSESNVFNNIENSKIIEKVVLELKNKPKKHINIESHLKSLKTKSGNIFSQSLLDEDLTYLSKHFDSIETSTQNGNNGKIIVRIEVTTLPILKSVHIEGNNSASNYRINSILELKLNDPFIRAKFLKNIKKLKIFYYKKGNFQPEIKFREITSSDNSFTELFIQIEEGPSSKVYSVFFEGISNNDKLKIKQFIFTSEYKKLLSWYTGKGIYHTEAIEKDRLKIIDYFQNKGYVDCRVKIIPSHTSPERVSITFVIDCGERYSFNKVEFSGCQSFKPSKIDSMFKIGAHSVYSQNKIRESIKDITKYYTERGYLDAHVLLNLSLDKQSKTFDASFTIEEGPRYKVGLIRLLGSSKRQTKNILNNTVIFPGEYFNSKKMELTENKLNRTECFKSVNLYAVDSELKKPNYKDLEIVTEDGSTGNFAVSLGSNSNSSIFCSAEISESNFNILGLANFFRNSKSSLRGNGEILHLKANIGDKLSYGFIQWSKPYIFSTNWTLGCGFEKNASKMLSNLYTIDSSGGNTSASYSITPDLRTSFIFRHKHSNCILNNPSQISPELTTTLIANNGSCSSLGWSLSHDSIDDNYEPTRGLRSHLGFEVSRFHIDTHYMKTSFLNTFYYSLSNNSVFKIKADVQWLNPLGSTKNTDIPFNERFFLGGENSVRGYKPFSIGPQKYINQPLGGLYSVLISEEIQTQLLQNPKLYGFAFVDAGFISNKSPLVDFNYVASVGFGVRFPAMGKVPVMLGFGYPIHSKKTILSIDTNTNITTVVESDFEQRFFFSLGGAF